MALADASVFSLAGELSDPTGREKDELFALATMITTGRIPAPSTCKPNVTARSMESHQRPS